MKFVRWLIDNGADPAKDKSWPFQEHKSVVHSPWQTGLNGAASLGKLDILKLLVAHGAKVEDNIPLHMAAGRKSIDENWERTVDYLLSIGVNVNGSDDKQLGPYFKGSPLCYAVDGEAVDAVKYLLKNGGNPYVGGGIQGTPFDMATKYNYTEMLDLFKTVKRVDEE
jgi:ankyrin repeat protein